MYDEDCAECGEPMTEEDTHDSGLIGTVPRCRACILKVDARMVSAEAIPA